MRMVLFALAALNLLLLLLPAVGSGRGPIPVSEVTFAIFVTGYAIVDAIDRLPRGPKAGP